MGKAERKVNHDTGTANEDLMGPKLLSSSSLDGPDNNVLCRKVGKPIGLNLSPGS